MKRHQEIAYIHTSLPVHLQKALLPGPWLLGKRQELNISSLLPTQNRKPRSFFLGSPTKEQSKPEPSSPLDIFKRS